MRIILDGYPDSKRIIDPQRSQIFKVIRDAENRGEYIDYISISNSILFSGKYATNYQQLEVQTLYNRIRSVDFNADNYLDNIDIVHCDYRQLVAQYRGQEGVCFITDPPYLSTQTTPYKGYWRLSNYLDVLTAIKGSNYIYFTSTKSNLIELCDWLEKEGSDVLNPLHGAQRTDKWENLNYWANYNEVMLYKHQRYNEKRIAA